MKAKIKISWFLDNLSARGNDARYYIKPLSSISPSDIRRGGQVIGNSITGFYTKVEPKAKWPNGVIPWEYDSDNTFSALSRWTRHRQLIKMV
jgi:hypothetical protein